MTLQKRKLNVWWPFDLFSWLQAFGSHQRSIMIQVLYVPYVEMRNWIERHQADCMRPFLPRRLSVRMVGIEISPLWRSKLQSYWCYRYFTVDCDSLIFYESEYDGLRALKRPLTCISNQINPLPTKFDPTQINCKHKTCTTPILL